MTNLLIRHKVKNYDVWKKAFDSFADTRKSSGEKSFQIYRPVEDTKNLHLLFQWDTVENARKFLESPSLKETMQKAGVIEAPEVKFFGEAYTGKL